MNRDYGQLILPGNIERNIATPLDTTMKVYTLSGLVHPDTFKSISDGIDYSYIGMFTVVVGDSDNNNGLYILKSFPTTDINNWQKLQSSIDNKLNTKSKNIIDAINELNNKTDEKASNTATVITAGGTYLKFNETDNYLILDNNTITEYTIDILISGINNRCFLKKTVEFSANTLSPDNIIISHCLITDEDAVDADIINAVVDVIQINNLPQIAINLITDIDCIAYLSINKLSNI